MRVLTPQRVGAILTALLGVLLVTTFVALGVGPSALSPGEVLDVVLGGEATTAAGDIVLRVRLPRILLAALVGASLAVSGVLFQARL